MSTFNTTVAHQFIEDEEEYKPYLCELADVDFNTEKTARFILRLTNSEGKRVSAAVMYLTDAKYSVIEVKRVGIPVDKGMNYIYSHDTDSYYVSRRFESIVDWWNNVVVHLKYPVDKYEDEVECMFKHILVGDNYTPLEELTDLVMYDQLAVALQKKEEDDAKEMLNQNICLVLFFLFVLIQCICVGMYLSVTLGL